MRWQIPLVVALALFAAVSCDQQPVEPAVDQVAETPTFNFMNNPDAGPKIYRYAQSEFFLFTDVDDTYMIIVGIDPADLCGDVADREFHSVFTPNDDGGDPWWVGQWIDNWQMKDIHASIYEFTGEPSDCVGLPAPLATGMGHANGNDNDFDHWDPAADVGNNNANTYGWNLNATMGSYNFNAHARCVWKRDFMESKCNFILNLK